MRSFRAIGSRRLWTCVIRCPSTRWSTVAISALALAVVAVIHGCGSAPGAVAGLLSGALADQGVSSQTVLSSTSLAGAAMTAQSVPTVTAGATGLRITPQNLTGKVLSVLFAIDGQDDGVVVFGNGRPDVAPTSAALYDFDLARQLPVSDQMELKPGFVGGASHSLVLIFGYVDVHFTVGGQARVMRVALADIGALRRGDLLLYHAQPEANADMAPAMPTAADLAGTQIGLDLTGFSWYDTAAQEFVSTRPASPAALAAVRDFRDPARPNLVFAPLSATLTQPVAFDAATLQAARSMTVTLDFQVQQAVLLVGQTAAPQDDATLITSFALAGVGGSGGTAGLRVAATVNITQGSSATTTTNGVTRTGATTSAPAVNGPDLNGSVSTSNDHPQFIQVNWP